MNTNIKNYKHYIICYEKGWIIEAIAVQLKNNLLVNYGRDNVNLLYGINNINDINDNNVIVYHLYYLHAILIPNAINLIYVTHIDSLSKLNKVIKLSNSKFDVRFMTMSLQTSNYLKKIIHDKEIFTAQQNSLHFKNNKNIPEILTVGLFFRLYNDDRKSNKDIIELFKIASNYTDNLKIIIYGDGFEKIHLFDLPNISYFKSNNFNVNEYKNLITQCDYVVAYGKDEGYISILDSTFLEIKSLALNQGFHKDIVMSKGSILFNSGKEINGFIENILQNISPKHISTLIDYLNNISKHYLNKKKQNIYFKYFLTLFIKNPFKLRNIYTILKKFKN